MKLLKKLLVVLMTITVSVSAAFFVACDDEKTGNQDNNGTGDNSSASNPVYVETVLNGIAESPLQSYDGKFDFSVVGGDAEGYVAKINVVDGKNVETDRINYPKSPIPDDVLGSYGLGQVNLDLKGNYTDGDLDLFVSPEIERRDGHYYWFFRGWEGYEIWSEEEIPDLTAVDVRHLGNEPILASTVGLAPRVNHIFIGLGNGFDGVSVDGDKLTVNLNKTAFNVLDGLSRTIKDLKPTTTVGELLSDKTVKSIVSSIVNGFTPEEIKGYIAEWLDDYMKGEELYDGIMGLFDKVAQDAGSTTFDYIIKILSSDEAYELLNNYLREEIEVSLPAKLDKLTVSFIIDAFIGYENIEEAFRKILPLEVIINSDGTLSYSREEVRDFSTFKQTLNLLIDTLFDGTTRDCFYFADSDNECVYSVSDAEIEYEISDGNIYKMSISAKLNLILDFYDRYNFEYEDNKIVSYDVSVGKIYMDYNISGELAFTSQKQELTNIKIN